MVVRLGRATVEPPKRHLRQAAIRSPLQKLECPRRGWNIFCPWIKGMEWGMRPETGRSAFRYRLHQAEKGVRGVVPPL
jgi:hypothetical protein